MHISNNIGSFWYKQVMYKWFLQIKISLILGFLCSGITLHHSDQLAYSSWQKKTSEKSDVVLMTSAKKIQLQLFSTPTSIYLLVICSSVVVNYFSFNWHSYMQYPTNNCIIECIYMYQWPSYLPTLYFQAIPEKYFLEANYFSDWWVWN